jgi:hypothetical protein
MLKATHWFPKLVKVADDVDQDAKTVLPEVITVIDDVDKLVVAAVKDAGMSFQTLEDLINSIVLAAEQGGMNFASDADVMAKFQAFANTIKADGNFHDVMVGLRTLSADYGKLGSSVKAALAQLEADAKA